MSSESPKVSRNSSYPDPAVNQYPDLPGSETGS